MEFDEEPQELQTRKRDNRLHPRQHQSRPVPLTPEITLHLADDPIALWEQTGEEPPFWAFAWAGGQALARHVLDNPTSVRGKTVLDMASGSGLVAIAAAMSGATRVSAVDIDPLSIAAITLNAENNGVQVATIQADILTEETTAEVVLAGDVCYDKTMSTRMVTFLHRAAQHAEVLLGDPGRTHLPKANLTPLSKHAVPATNNLEADGTTITTVWRYAGTCASPRIVET